MIKPLTYAKSLYTAIKDKRARWLFLFGSYILLIDICPIILEAGSGSYDTGNQPFRLQQGSRPKNVALQEECQPGGKLLSGNPVRAQPA